MASVELLCSQVIGKPEISSTFLRQFKSSQVRLWYTHLSTNSKNLWPFWVLDHQLQTNASIRHHSYKEATQNVILQRLIRLVILCHHKLEQWDHLALQSPVLTTPTNSQGGGNKLFYQNRCKSCAPGTIQAIFAFLSKSFKPLHLFTLPLFCK